MKNIKKQGRNGIKAFLIMILFFTSYLGFIHGENMNDITGTFQEVESADKQLSTVTLNVVTNTPDAKIIKITSPDGKVIENASTVTYDAHENKEYSFLVSYSVVNNDEETPVIEEKQTTLQYTVTKIESKVVEDVTMPKALSDQQTVFAAPRATSDVPITANTFPDENFRKEIMRRYGANDGILSATEIDGAVSFDLKEAICGATINNVQSIEGIEYFPNLINFSIEATKVETIDLSKNTKVKVITITKNDALKSVKIGSNAILTDLTVYGAGTDGSTSNLTGTIDTSGCPNLLQLKVESTAIEALDLTNNTKLTTIECSRNKLKTLNVSTLASLVDLTSTQNLLTTLDVSNCVTLKKLMLTVNKDLATLNLGNISKLTYLDIKSSKIDKIDISRLTELETLWIQDTNIRYIDNTNNLKIKKWPGVTTKPLLIPLDKTKRIDLRDYLNTETLSKISSFTVNGVAQTFSNPIIENIDPTKRFMLKTKTPAAIEGVIQELTTYIRPQGANEWITPLSIDSWSLGEQAKQPLAESCFGSDTVTYQYSDAIDGTYVDEVPTTAGVWYVKAKVAEVTTYAFGMYSGLESDPVQFSINNWTSPLTIDDWNYGDTPKQPQITAIAGTDDIAYEYADQKDGTYTSDIPDNAGTWYVRAVLGVTSAHGGLTSEGVPFVIHKGLNSWVNEPFMRDWTLGSTDALPSAEAIFGNDGVYFQYSNQKDGVYTNEVPNEIGIWYMKAIVDGTKNYGKLETVVSFQIIRAEIIGGTSVTYTTGSAENAVFTCSGLLDDLSNVYVDGHLLSSDHYTLKSGSTILSLQHDYLDTLKPGSHILRFEYGSESAEIAFEIIKGIDNVVPVPDEPQDNVVPTPDDSKDKEKIQTGDTSSPVLWTALLIISGVLLVVISKSKKELSKK